MANKLDKISVGYSGLTDSIYLYRFGKDKGEALDKRDAEKDVLACITEKMMWGADKGGWIEYRFGDQGYKLTVEKIADGDKNE
ncbi:unnamed protein product [marine sediment metagenome]|uniref:Uncharacterized protein n=1 Tax=marine sediment metagenome TaxID=412755 RepID=X0ULF3_9ZZZZ